MSGDSYEKAQMIPMSDLDNGAINTQPTGVPVVVFVLVAAVTVAGAAFIVGAGIGWTVAVGTSSVVSPKK